MDWLDHRPAGGHSNRHPAIRRRASRLPVDWRERLPDPATYYVHHVKKLTRPGLNGWASGHCCLHDDSTASLSVNLEHGGWRCHAGCGGGDLVAFHMRRTNLGFYEAVADLIGWHS